MNIFTLIKRDHDEARDLMDQIIKTEAAASRLELYEKLKTSILAHAKSEEKTFYNALKNADDELAEETPHMKKEHKEAEDLFKEIDALEPDYYLWWEKFGELRKALTHHMEEEEKEIFPEAKKEIPTGEAKELGEEMEELEDAMKAKLDKKQQAA